MTVNRVAVLGAGTMGSQIAALFAGQDIECDLLDIATEGTNRNYLAENAIERLRGLRPNPIAAENKLGLIQPGNFSDDLPRLSTSDWIIEAVTEDIEIKKSLLSQAVIHIHPNAVISTNTSGIPIKSIAEKLPAQLRGRFLGTHFFNPPRYLRLLEIIPGPDTSPNVVSKITGIAAGTLERRCVLAHDVPGFIANRLWTYGTLVTLRAAENLGLGASEVDDVTGQAMKRPNSATFRTLDLVGLDVFVNICDNMRKSLTDLDEKAAFEIPQYVREMVSRGWTGDKVGQGFFRREDSDGEKRILSLDLGTFSYLPRRQFNSVSLKTALDMENSTKRLKTLTEADDQTGRLAWTSLSSLMVYAARNVGKAANDITSIDRSMRWGFAWKLGLFEVWDALGVDETVSRMRSDGLAVPDWVQTLASLGTGFYATEAGRKVQFTPEGRYVPVPRA